METVVVVVVDVVSVTVGGNVVVGSVLEAV
jgi:hypothetical protein